MHAICIDTQRHRGSFHKSITHATVKEEITQTTMQTTTDYGVTVSKEVQTFPQQ